MCIRDSFWVLLQYITGGEEGALDAIGIQHFETAPNPFISAITALITLIRLFSLTGQVGDCLLYTSDVYQRQGVV